MQIDQNMQSMRNKSEPEYEMEVLPGTAWEIAKYSKNEFYAYQYIEGEMYFIMDEEGKDKRFLNRWEAVEAIYAAHEFNEEGI